MFSDKIDYEHPEILPYSDGRDSEVLFSWILGALVVGGLLAINFF